MKGLLTILFAAGTILGGEIKPGRIENYQTNKINVHQIYPRDNKDTNKVKYIQIYPPDDKSPRDTNILRYYQVLPTNSNGI